MHLSDSRTQPSPETFQLLVDAVSDYALYMLDPAGRIVTWNSGAERFKGYSAEEIIGEHFSRFFLPQDREAGVPALALETAARDGRFEAEGWRIRKDGSRFWAHAILDAIRGDDGSLVGFAKITRDITEKRRLEQATYESALQLKMLVKGVRDYAIYMLDRDGRITSWNAGAQAIKGYAEEEVLGKHFSLFYTAEDRAGSTPERALQAALEEGKFEAEAQRVRKDGSLFWAHVVIDPIYNDAGEHVGFAKITRDVSERKQAEHELRQTQEALLQSQKLQALGELAGGIAHDFNNLMTVMRGSADFLLRQPDMDVEKRNRYLSVMLDTAERATGLTSQLLAFARRQPLEPEVIDLSVRLDAMGEMLGRTLGSLYELELNLAPALWPVEIDPNGLEAALLNAVVNARDAMPHGGKITLSTANDKRSEGDGVLLSIRDTGEGIPPETLKRVFEPFFTTKPIGKGTGLGLSQIHGYALQSGGSARIESEVGKGTLVELWLPRTNKHPLREAVSQLHAMIPAGLRVLVVEDSEHVRYFARQLLDDLGCKVIEASNGSEALELLKEHDVDLVFSDIVMPGMSGLELATQIRDTYTDIPVLLASGYSSKQFIPRDEREFPILRKPYNLATLAAGINQLVNAADGRDRGKES
ncbi:PAS domain-containing sensor histidine kinase [Sphingomonas sp. NIBR02145]|uniref:hybrid sensor histidine kinase/response regulator n=1 Tax=Sphingomonas sp. NIBR02145 TaxID=3014784 RepID=UPI0022B553F7|nr:PAS domain-containing sensor histidine kinase [Sphingomonas sp. NIBR02145]WHU04312.1 PAS domain S-box protein [Sphingomonas sp. NIBR02145]